MFESKAVSGLECGNEGVRKYGSEILRENKNDGRTDYKELSYIIKFVLLDHWMKRDCKTTEKTLHNKIDPDLICCDLRKCDDPWACILCRGQEGALKSTAEAMLGSDKVVLKIRLV